LASQKIIYQARKIITMDPDRPVATHVAVRDGRILGVGSREELLGWGSSRLDQTFADKVLMPGLVEGHSHVYEGMVWENVYVGSYDRRDPDGKVWSGVGTVDALVDRLREFEARLGSVDEPLTGWGFDPLFVEGRLTMADLDRVSRTRPVLVYHASFHIINANSAVVQRAGVSHEVKSDFILRDAEGRLTGEFAGQVGRYMLLKGLGHTGMSEPGDSPEAVRRFAKSAQLAGATTVTDLHNDLSEATVQTYRAVTAETDFPVRLVPGISRRAAAPGCGGLCAASDRPQHRQASPRPREARRRRIHSRVHGTPSLAWLFRRQQERALVHGSGRTRRRCEALP
jgi:predicted amidohydrolase YtcJ